MCVVSMITDYYGRNDKWRQYNPQERPFDPLEPYRSLSEREIERQKRQNLVELKAMMDLINKGKEVDKITGEPDCEAPGLKKVIQEIQDRLTALEKEIYGSAKDRKEATEKAG